MREKPRVLFVCTHNAARSQIAEALLRHHAGGRFEASSAGLEPTVLHPMTSRVLQELGVSAAGLYAKGLREFLGRQAVRHAIFVCAQAEASCPRTFPFAVETLSWPFDDPTVGDGGEELEMARFRRVRDEIDARLRAWLRTVPETAR